MSHRIERTWKQRLARAIPFGIGQTKPKHFRYMARIAWENRDNLAYAWKVLSRGVCDGCSLGVAGLHDWTIEGVHLCMTRLNLMRLNTMPALDVRRLEDVEALRALAATSCASSAGCRYPMLRERGDRGFRRITWDGAYARIAARIRATTPRAHRLLPHLAGDHERDLLRRAEGGALPRYEQRRQRGASLPLAVDRRDEARPRRRGDDVQLPRLVGNRPDRVLRLEPGQRSAGEHQVPARGEAPRHQGGSRQPVSRAGHGRATGCRRPSRSALFGTDVADYWFGVSHGGDIAFLYGVLKTLIENGWYDAVVRRASTPAASRS